MVNEGDSLIKLAKLELKKDEISDLENWNEETEEPIDLK